MTGIIILAAGASSRLGRPKQTLEFEDKSLLKRAITAAIKANVGPVVVVIGANENEIRSHCKNDSVHIHYNKNWEEGIGSSIAAGVSFISQLDENIGSVIVMVCDQLYVYEDLLKKLVETRLVTQKPIVACSYNGTAGVPALFEKSMWDELQNLKGEEGGKKVLFKFCELTALVPFDKGVIDIDTIADYEGLKSLHEQPML